MPLSWNKLTPKLNFKLKADLWDVWRLKKTQWLDISLRAHWVFSMSLTVQSTFCCFYKECGDKREICLGVADERCAL